MFSVFYMGCTVVVYSIHACTLQERYTQLQFNIYIFKFYVYLVITSRYSRFIL